MNLARLAAIAAALSIAACANASPSSEPGKHARGDYDGDGRTDTATFEENDEGNLVLIVRRAAAPDAPLEIWGGDISAYPRFVVRTAPAGTYRTDCEAYGGCSGDVPAQVTRAHDGIIAHEIDGAGGDTYYYWDGAGFRNISIPR